MSKRRRINLSLREETYDELQQIVRDYHFKNACEVVNTLISLFLNKVRNQYQPASALGPEDEDERYIRDMFDEFETWEPTPQAGHAPVIKRPRRTK